MELTIVVPGRSWARNFDANKLGKKKKGKNREKGEFIQTAELDRRDQVTATTPGPVPSERGDRGR
jgi:hypothetical protein